MDLLVVAQIVVLLIAVAMEIAAVAVILVQIAVATGIVAVMGIVAATMIAVVIVIVAAIMIVVVVVTVMTAIAVALDSADQRGLVEIIGNRVHAVTMALGSDLTVATKILTICLYSSSPKTMKNKGRFTSSLNV